MALLTHVGGAESDSFITVSEADDHLERLPDNMTEWENLSVDEKELRLQLAAHLMGHLPFRGYTVYRHQRLCFPRTCQPYERRFLIPDDIKRAQAFIAYSIVHRNLKARAEMDVDGADPSWGRPRSISLAGLVSVSFSGESTATNMLEDLTRSMPFPVYMLLKPYLSQVRGRSVPDVEDLRTLSTTTTTTTTTITTTTTTA